MDRSALVFCPSPASYGFVQDLYSYATGSAPEEVTAAAEGRVPHGESMIDAVDQVNIGFIPVGVLTSLTGLRHGELMRPVAAADSEAQLKASYWLHVAARSFESSVIGTSPRDRLESKADGLATRGEAEITTEGSSSRQSNITGIYADAARSLREEMDGAGGGTPVQSQIYDILAKGASADAVKASISRQTAQSKAVEADLQKRKEKAAEKPCEETLIGKIPGMCEAQQLTRVLVIGGVGVVGVYAIYSLIQNLRGQE